MSPPADSPAAIAQSVHPEAESEIADRLAVHRFPAAEGGDSFAEDVRRGLTADPRWLPSKYFYDPLGSHLFEAICLTPEYYLTRAESEILERHGDEIIAASPSPARLVELGSGSSLKTRFLIEALLRRQGELHYLPIDISSSAVARSARELLTLYPELTATAYAADYSTALEALAREEHPEGVHTLALFLGSTIGNFEPITAGRLMSAVRRALLPGDGFLLGADLKKDPAILEAAYNDSLGVTAAFNRNVLLRINRELGGDFDLTKFGHRARYDADKGRIESHVVSQGAQAVAIRQLDLEIEFDDGDTIHTESSYKYDRHDLEQLAEASGFQLEKCWTDERQRFSFNLLVAG